MQIQHIHSFSLIMHITANVDGGLDVQPAEVEGRPEIFGDLWQGVELQGEARHADPDSYPVPFVVAERELVAHACSDYLLLSTDRLHLQDHLWIQHQYEIRQTCRFSAEWQKCT